MSNYKTRTLSVIVLPEKEPIFSERGTIISIVDEASGEFIEVKQDYSNTTNTIRIDPFEWPSLRSAINKMINECRD